MKAFYISANGRTYVEDVNPNVRLIEEADGIHPLQPTNVFVNDEHKTNTWGADDSVCIIHQGISGPESFTPDGLTLDYLSYEIEDDSLTKLANQKQSISKRFWRQLSNLLSTGVMLGMCFGIFLCFAVLGYALILIFVVH